MYYAPAQRGRSARQSRPYARRSAQRSNISRAHYVREAQPAAEIQPYQAKHQFADFGFEPAILENIIRRGYTQPTPIQDQAIPLLMDGTDVVGIANTGTGKTAAFLLPFIHRVLTDPDQGVLIVAPTRELAVQIFEELQAFIARLPLGVALCIGGANINSQMDRLRRAPHFVIGTPGRLKDLINRHALKTELYTNIVLDEVDRMLDIGFLPDVKFLISHLPTNRHSAFFSATMNSATTTVMQLFLKNPVTIKVSQAVNTTQIDQDIVTLNPGETKLDALHQMLNQDEFEKVIVFGRTKHGINKLEQQLHERGLRVCAIHGNKSQGARQKSLQDFKRGRVKALLATDIVARGIDVDGVTHVINYDEPMTYDDYIHRIGRTGRAGKPGKALTFVS